MRTFITILVTAIVTATCTYFFTTNYTIVPINEKVETETKTVNTNTESVEETLEQEWMTYSNDKFGFALAYPPNTIIEDPRVGRQSTYIRLQNYSPLRDRLGLDAGEYYAEIRAFDPEIGHTPYEECLDESIKHISEPMGDTGGQIWTRCFIKDDKTVFINVTENSNEGKLAKEILESLEY